MNDWPFEQLDFELDPRQAALLIIDVQYFDAHPDWGLGPAIRGGMGAEGGAYYFDRINELVVPNVGRLADAFREIGGAVIHIVTGPHTRTGADLLPRQRVRRRDMATRYPITGDPPGIYPPGSFEREEIPGIVVAPDDIVLTKSTTSAFTSSPIDHVLRMLKIETVLLTGVITNNCVESTGRDASDHGYNCILVDDACAAYDPESHASTVRNFHHLFGRVDRTAHLLDALASNVGA